MVHFIEIDYELRDQNTSQHVSFKTTFWIHLIDNQIIFYLKSWEEAFKRDRTTKNNSFQQASRHRDRQKHVW